MNSLAEVLSSNTDIITPEQVEADYKIPVTTQRAWKCTNRYGWRDLTIKRGRCVVYRRSAVEQWFTSRTGIAG